MASDLMTLFAVSFPTFTGLVALVSGVLSDKVPRNKISRIAPIFLVLASLIGLCTQPSQVTILSLSALLAIFTGVEYTCTRTLIAEFALPTHRFKWSSEVIVFYNLGIVVSLVWFAYFYGTPLSIYGLFTLSLVLGILLILGRWGLSNPSIQTGVLKNKCCQASFWKYFFTTRVLKIFLFLGCTYILYSVVLAILINHGIYVNLGDTISSYLVFGLCTIFAIQNLFCVFFPERAKMLYAVAALTFLVMMYALQALPDLIHGIGFALIFGLLLGISPNLFYQQWVVEFTPTRYRSTMRGIFSFVNRVLIGLGVYLSQSVNVNNLFEISFIVCLISSFFAIKHMPNSTGVTLGKVDARFDPCCRK